MKRSGKKKVKVVNGAIVIENYYEVQKEEQEEKDADWVYLNGESENEDSANKKIAEIVVGKDAEKTERADLNKEAESRSYALFQEYHRLGGKMMSWKDWERARKRDNTFIAGKLEQVEELKEAREAQPPVVHSRLRNSKATL